MKHVRPLPDGPIALIGDVHGELEALDALLGHLDCDHPDHHIVFLGDLADRGPDSPGVIRRVRERMERGAQCIFGNHELSVLRGEDRKYNRWFFGGSWTPAETGGDPVPMAPLPPEERDGVQAFFASLPLALERPDLRVVHACWDPASIEVARGFEGSILELFVTGPTHDLPEPPSHCVPERAQLVRDPVWEQAEARQQNDNPVAVLTSGMERPGPDSSIVWSGNKWRPLVRVRWWEDYDVDVDVVIGHYSRMWDAEDRRGHAKTALMFGADTPPGAPLGPARRVWCIDYAVGTRFEDRHAGRPYRGRLGALLFDERPRRIVFDNGGVALC